MSDAPSPQCRHKRTGIVKAGDPHGAYAAVNVCDRDECVAAARFWVQGATGQPSEYVPDRRRY